MNEDFLPKYFQENVRSKSKEEFQEYVYTLTLDEKREISWIIGHIRKTLKEIQFPSLDTLTEDDKERIELYQADRNDQLVILDICEKNIKTDTNTLLNSIAGSVNHKWDDIFLGEIVAFRSDKVKRSNNLIPLPLQSLSYTLSARFCLLVKCAINAITLNYKVAAIYQKTQPIHFEQILEKMYDKIDKLYNKIDKRYRVIPNTQDDLADWVRKGIIEYCKEHMEFESEGIHFPRKPTIISMFGDWNKYIKAPEEKRKELKAFEPYPHFSYIRYDSQDEVVEWGREIFAPTYYREQKKKMEKKGKKKKIDALDRKCIGGNAGESIIDKIASKEDREGYL